MALVAYCLILLYLKGDNTVKSSPLNVGTVLFYGADKRSCWTTEDIALLRSRRILQSILPPIDLAQVNDEKYVQFLLKYFEQAFGVVKRKAKDLNAQMVSQALADTVGGYMKYWALPVSRYGYYGGTVSYESAKNLTDYYENIKETLKTDGYAWRPADETVYKSMNFRIITAPAVDEDPKRRSNACKDLNFYRTANSELTIPMPQINWEHKPHMMMIPMQNNSLVALQDPDSAYSLFNFYMDAQNCLLTEQNLEPKIDFDDRFRRWISTVVLPHLKEDALYVAFGSVFRLLNGTRDRLSPYELKSIVFPESSMIRILNNNTIECKVNSMIRKLPIFLTALLVLWCGPCILYFYFKNIRCRTSCGGPGGVGDRFSKPTMKTTTELFPNTTEFWRHRKRSSKRCEQTYPCEVLYSYQKHSEHNDKSPKSSSVNTSKTSSNIKMSELLLKVRHANSVQSNNFEKELKNEISQTKFTQIRNSGKTFLEKLQTAELPQAKSETSITQFDSKIKEMEGDHLSETINYFSSAYTKRDDLISEDPCVEMPESLCTIVQEVSSTFTRSTCEIKSEIPSKSISDISIRSLPNLTKVVKLVPQITPTPHTETSTLLLAHEASKLADVTPELPEVRLQLADVKPELAEITQLAEIVPQFEDLPQNDESETPECSSADRKDKRPSRIPQRRKSSLKQRKFSVATMR